MPTRTKHLHDPLLRRLPSRRRLLATLAGGVAACTWAASPVWAAPDFGLAELMKTLAQVRAGEATFVERRQVAMLDRTLESSGRLSFAAPDTFIRETLKPRRERLAVTGNTVTMSQGNRSGTMQLDASAEASVIVEAIRGTLTGNRDALERHFEATVSGGPERWSLDLVPREVLLREQVSTVKVTGEQSRVREVQVLLADGDRSIMTIQPGAPLASPASPASLASPASSGAPASPAASASAAAAARSASGKP